MRASAPTVFIIDDDPSIRRSLAELFKLENFKVEMFADAEEFIARKTYKRPACLVSDIRMPGISGLDLQEFCEKQGITIPMVFITGHGDIPMTVEAMKNGAVDFLQKPYNTDKLLKIVRQAINKDHDQLRDSRSKKRIIKRFATMSEREVQVFKNVAAGFLNKQIAIKMGISEKTVKFHRAAVMRKMKAISIAHLVRLAEATGVAPKKN